MNVPMDMQNTQAVPRADSGGSTSGSWPIPSPPPVGEAPPSAYDPLQDTCVFCMSIGTFMREVWSVTYGI
jgi:hypothetical protein